MTCLVGTVWGGPTLNADQQAALQTALWYVISGGTQIFTPNTPGADQIYDNLIHDLTGAGPQYSNSWGYGLVYNSSTTYSGNGVVLMTPDGPGTPPNPLEYQSSSAMSPPSPARWPSPALVAWVSWPMACGDEGVLSPVKAFSANAPAMTTHDSPEPNAFGWCPGPGLRNQIGASPSLSLMRHCVRRFKIV